MSAVCACAVGVSTDRPAARRQSVRELVVESPPLLPPPLSPYRRRSAAEDIATTGTADRPDISGVFISRLRPCDVPVTFCDVTVTG